MGRDEVRNLFQKLIGRVPDQYLFDAVDRDGSGTIEFAEFETYFGQFLLMGSIFLVSLIFALDILWVMVLSSLLWSWWMLESIRLHGLQAI